jgi:hypothetical protein
MIGRDNVLLVRARGYIGPSVLREELDKAASFGESHADGWWYVVDTTAVRLPNPVNPLLLRRIRSLPNIRGYVVIAPSGVMRAAATMFRWLVRPNAVVRSESEALELVSR